MKVQNKSKTVLVTKIYSVILETMFYLKHIKILIGNYNYVLPPVRLEKVQSNMLRKLL